MPQALKVATLIHFLNLVILSTFLLICAAYGVDIAIVVVRGAIAVTAALVLSEFLLLLAFAAKKV